MIPKATLGRLPTYLKYLHSLPSSVKEIPATTVAKELGLGEVQVRKDLSTICGSGKPKVGYDRAELTQSVKDILLGKQKTEAVIVGAGKLGMALLDYPGFAEYGLTVTKAFDAEKTKCSEQVLSMDEFPRYCSLHQVEIGILTVPPSAAQEVAEQMVQSGIRAIWCFSSSHLQVPDFVSVQYENLALSLAHLHNKIKQVSR